MVTKVTIQRCLKTPFECQHVQRFQTLVKTPSEYFYQIFSSLWGEIIWKTSPWLNFSVIGLFVNTWTADYKYLIPDCENLSFLIQIQLSSKKKTFSRFFIPFIESPSNFKYFQKRKIVIGNVFAKLATVQGLVTSLTNQRRLKNSFDSHHVKRFQTLVICSWEHFYHIFWSMWEEIIWQTSPWLNFCIIGLFVNTWTADHKYPVPDCENLPLPIQIQLS